ncbi:hypothetical protein [Marinobacter psychrophilus]|uniref:hypothetical protein n=1 Tax=Marinobacter psychrophilus TaxID=330734 RepID=UPI000A9EEA8E|nr:hypothetical protein [Marinobacter psychrophilus]
MKKIGRAKIGDNGEMQGKAIVVGASGAIGSVRARLRLHGGNYGAGVGSTA